MSKLIDGRKLADELKKKLFILAQNLERETGIRPCLAVIRVGENPSSLMYVRTKGKQAESIGYDFEEHWFPEDTTFQQVEDRIHLLNETERVHGIILQLPLPNHLDKLHLLSSINPEKDVDGLHPLNSGKLSQGVRGGFVPCTPLGCFSLIKTVHTTIEGKSICMVGSSLLVGRPLAMLLLNHRATVSLANSKTLDLRSLCKMADILIVAIGKPQFIQGEWIKEGATVIDVGINRLPSGEIVGDVNFDQAFLKAGAITPVPGGVGPMTVACLLRNTLEAAYHHASQPFPL